MWTGSKNDLVKFLNESLSIKFVYEILKEKKKIPRYSNIEDIKLHDKIF